MRSLLTLRSLAGRVFLIEIAIVLLLVVAALVAMVLQARSSSASSARRLTRGVAEAFAHGPGMVQALDSPDPSAVLQPQAEAVRQATGVDSVVVINTDYIQLTSPYPSYVGRPYTPPPGVAQNVIPQLKAGRTVTYDLKEPGLDAIATAVPVFGPGGQPKGVVSVDIAVGKVNSVVGAHLPVLLGGAAAAVAVAAVGTALTSRWLLRRTRGLGPAELVRMYDHHDAVLHAVREGVLIVDGDGRLTLANDEARRLLDLPAHAEHRPVASLGLDRSTTELLTSAGEVTDGVHQAGDRLLAVNKRPTAPYGGFPGSVVTLRDSTELHELTSRVEAAGKRRQLLYEAGLQIGTTLDMTRTCDELAAVPVGAFADSVSVDLMEEVTLGEDPKAGGGRMRRIARRDITGSRMTPPDGEVFTVADSTPQARSLAGGGAVLEPGPESVIVAPLQLRGTVLGLVEFRRERGAPFDRDDLDLAAELAARAAVSIDNARRYTREHSLAVALQRSLLPRNVPDRTGLRVAYRYLPASAGVSGDWFDVIALPGFRTALVVGDVVGHGVAAAVAMGLLRTAIRNFSTLDLPPDEVLGRLDELVQQLDEEAGSGEITGSTCLYAVYDPVSGNCSLARAGHLGPALIAPDGTASYPEVAGAPPLGVGGQPFETTELRLPAGSRLVLFTDGLVETRRHDIESGLERLRSALSDDGHRGPDETCEAVTRELLTPHPADDVALLVARTDLLSADHVADWEVEVDPAAVAPVRTACADRLTQWGLEEIGFTTELILSELITNAIRYGAPPIRVRLLRNGSLVCEVSDGSSTAPHLRWAATTDEGGRGMFLVAQMSHRWGTRYTPEGKVIWSEQFLPRGPGATP